MSITGFCELALTARDPDGLARFYVERFGLSELSREDDRIWLSAGDSARLGLRRPGKKEFGDEGGTHVHFAFAVNPGALDAIADRPAPRVSISRDRWITTAATARCMSRIPRAISLRRGITSSAGAP